MAIPDFICTYCMQGYFGPTQIGKKIECSKCTREFYAGHYYGTWEEWNPISGIFGTLSHLVTGWGVLCPGCKHRQGSCIENNGRAVYFQCNNCGSTWRKGI